MSYLLIHPRKDLHELWGPNSRVGLHMSVRGFHGVLFSSRVIFLTPRHSLQHPGALGDEVASGCLQLVTKPSHVGGLHG
jgi:hypothetical protein